MTYNLILTGKQLNSLGVTSFTNVNKFYFIWDDSAYEYVLNLFVSSLNGLEYIDIVKEMPESSKMFAWRSDVQIYVEFEDEETALYWSVKYLS